MDTVIAAMPPVSDLSADSLNSITNPFLNATINSLILILVTEIGDKTFFIAAILAMRHGRLVVYSGAMIALGIMHVLSSVMGFALPSLIPKSYTHFASSLLFLYFGLRLLKDAYDMDEGPSDELQEVEEELKLHKGDGKEEGTEDVEKGNDSNMEILKRNAAAESFKVFTQAFTLTFLAEWGDRSQIATIALAASKNPFGVVLGGLIGHAFCTGLAVIGGKMLASRISERMVAIIGGILFIVFSITSFIFGPEE